MTTLNQTTSVATSTSRTEALTAAIVALVLGAALVFTTGFSQSDTLHNAGHDTRHALSFPCH